MRGHGGASRTDACSDDGLVVNRTVVEDRLRARDAASRDLGRRGEEFVVEFERRRLHDIDRRPELSKQIEWTARDRGDGAG